VVAHPISVLFSILVACVIDPHLCTVTAPPKRRNALGRSAWLLYDQLC